jgi:hypothetical protein
MLHNWFILLPEICILSFFAIITPKAYMRKDITSKSFFSYAQLFLLASLASTIIFYNKSPFPQVWENTSFTTIFKIFVYLLSWAWFYLSSIWFLNKNRPSGYFYSIGSIFKLSEYTGVDTDRQELLDLIDEKYFKYCDYAEAYWDAHKSGKELGNWINNLYLLLSGVAEGTDSYRDNELETDVNTGEITSYTNFQKIYLDLFF